ncbi:Copper chaperone CopZ [Alphaproteobacteria bacterium SO-S41]|nr:Copper chaperone CopZ [Alphaproteobacteria bacterium SO-S41]
MAELVIPVAGMDCGGCVKAVERAVGHLPGVTSVKADLAANNATVVYDDGVVTPAAIAETITRAGFQAAA